MTSNFIPPLHPDFSYRVDHVGQEQQPVLVIDNFLDRAELLIDVVENHCTFGESTYLYPGVQALVPAFYTGAIYTYLRQLICSTFGIRSENITHSKSNFSMVITPPAQLQPMQSKPHIDSLSNNVVAAIHYLCTEDKGGTSLYRHRATGFEMITKERLEKFNHHSAKEMEVSGWQGKYMNGSNEFYEQIASYDAVFNRIIMYRGNCLHSGNIGSDFTFDANPRTGRLTLNTFINAGE